MGRAIFKELPPIGTKLVHYFYKKVTKNAQIVKDKSFKSGKAIAYNGKRYTTLTECAVAITGKSTNGWIYWRTKKS